MRLFAGRSFSAALFAAAALALGAAAPAGAVTLTQISSDPFTNSSSQHRTEVEPDTFARGSTIVSAFQVGRFYDGGSSDIGWARSTDGGSTWTNGFLPGITVYQGGGPFARVSDPSVAYDAKDNVWMISSLVLNSSVQGAGVVVSRSTDGGATWGNPRTVYSTSSLSTDKNWTACDNTPTSPYYGRCYTEWDNNGDSNRIKMSTSTDGGLTWGSALSIGGSATGLGGQPVVQPNGTVVVPIGNANVSSIRAFKSTNGGASWTTPVTVATVTDHPVAAGLRTEPLPSAEIDAAGKVYVVWQDCRFRANCYVNDIVMSTSTDGTTWSPVVRIPTDRTDSDADHFIPGLAVDPSTSGSSARLALTYYYYNPASACASTPSKCVTKVAFMSSTNGGQTWTWATRISDAMSLSYIADTNQGRMVGDYISTSFANGNAVPVFAAGRQPSGGVFNEAMYAPAGGMPVAAGSNAASSKGAVAASGASASAQAHAHSARAAH